MKIQIWTIIQIAKSGSWTTEFCGRISCLQGAWDVAAVHEEDNVQTALA